MEGLIFFLSDFLRKYFIDPIVYREGAYNPVNTTVYALIAFFALLKTDKYLKKKVTYDLTFTMDLLPFILLGSSLRVIDDAEILRTVLFVTPLIYFLVYAVWILSFHYFVAVHHNYFFHMLLGWVLALSALTCLFLRPAVNLSVIIYAFLYLCFFVLSVFLVKKTWRSNFLSETGWAAVASQGLDGLITFLGVSSFGYAEEHVFPRFFFGVAPPWLFFASKLILAIMVVLVLMRFEEGGGIWVPAIYVLGLAPALRDALRILLAV